MSQSNRRRVRAAADQLFCLPKDVLWLLMSPFG
jgi:hypothetical protein